MRSTTASIDFIKSMWVYVMEFGSLADLLLGGGGYFKGSSGVKANLLSNFTRNYFASAFPEEDINMLTGSSVSQIPLDA